MEQQWKEIQRWRFDKFPIFIETSASQRAKKKKVLTKDKLSGKVITEEVVTNSKDIGKAKYEKISGNSIFFGALNGFNRSQIIDRLKSEYLLPIIDAHPEPTLNFPIKTKLIIHTIKHHGGIQKRHGKDVYTKSTAWDIDNLGMVWSKVILDSLRTKSFIPDDNIDYITNAGETQFEPVEDIEERYLEFIVYEKL